MKCEKTVLCETSQDAQHAIHAPNVNAVYTADGSKRYKKFSTLVRLHFFLEIFCHVQVNWDRQTASVDMH